MLQFRIQRTVRTHTSDFESKDSMVMIFTTEYTQATQCWEYRLHRQ